MGSRSENRRTVRTVGLEIDACAASIDKVNVVLTRIKRKLDVSTPYYDVDDLDQLVVSVLAAAVSVDNINTKLHKSQIPGFRAS